MLIQNDKISVIFLCLQAKLQLSKVIKFCCSAQAIEKFFRQLFNLKKACFCNFTMLQKQEKSLHLSLKQAELQELNSVSNMPAEIDIDAFKSFTKSRTK